MATFKGFEDPEEIPNSREKPEFSKASSRKPLKTKFCRNPETLSHLEAHSIPDEARLSTSTRVKGNDHEVNPDILKNIHHVKTSENVNQDLSPDSNQEAWKKNNHEELKIRREQIERENKLRQEILAKAIAERKRQTTSESEKLKQVQKELFSIDQELSIDVKHLMNAIQNSSVEFAEAEKRYSRAESEYVLAKLNLQVKTEKKELLMEHLSIIIEQNELRKADRLSKIMEELGLCQK